MKLTDVREIAAQQRPAVDEPVIASEMSSLSETCTQSALYSFSPSFIRSFTNSCIYTSTLS